MTATRDEHRKRLGQAGEAEAAAELERRGYVVLARNYRCRGGEADIVAEDAGDLVFVEVKARGGLQHGLPRDAVGWTKQQRLGHAARHFCFRHEIDEDRPIRFDVVEVVTIRGQVAAVELIRDAFTPDG